MEKEFNLSEKIMDYGYDSKCVFVFDVKEFIRLLKEETNNQRISFIDWITLPLQWLRNSNKSPLFDKINSIFANLERKIDKLAGENLTSENTKKESSK